MEQLSFDFYNPVTRDKMLRLKKLKTKKVEKDDGGTQLCFEFQRRGENGLDANIPNIQSGDE